jgi:hypothetical protein
MTKRRGWPVVWPWISGLGLSLALVSGLRVTAQTGPLASARAQAKTPVPTPKVAADGDAGLVGEVPLDTRTVPDPTDASLPESPVASGRAPVRIRANTPIKLRLTQAVDSGAQRNGDTVAGVLLDPVRASNGTVLKPGTPVKATVLAAAKAGQLQSAGVLSLQLYQVGGLPVTSNVLEFSGNEGKREVADANPEKGTEASVQPGTELRFEVLGSGDQDDPAGAEEGMKPASGSAATVGDPAIPRQPPSITRGEAATPSHRSMARPRA